MDEMSKSLNKTNLVIQKQLDQAIEIKIKTEKALRKNIQLGKHKDTIRINIASIVIQMGFIEHYRKALKKGHLSEPFNILKETDKLRRFEQESRKKFHVPDSIPVIYKEEKK